LIRGSRSNSIAFELWVISSRGAKSSELPFEQPTHYLFVLSLKTAKSTGLEIPATLLPLANEVRSQCSGFGSPKHP
jgi:hypothetical protein